MLEVAATANNRHTGHPLWHLLIVAGSAVGVFVVIRVKERWTQHNRHHHVRRPIYVKQSLDALRARGAATGPVLTLALLSATTSMIHAAVSPEHFHEAFLYGAFFLTASALQAAWSVAFIYRPNRTMLHAAIIGNAAVIALWTVTRTVGLPIGPQTWTPEPLGTLDVTTTCLELIIVVGAAKLLARPTPAPRDTIKERLELVHAHHPTLLRQHTDPAS